MKLEKYISDLLYRYDLVIVPGFGGIVGRKKSANYDAATYIFSPPHKDLSFNGSLTENDGLLVRYVADVLQISNENALGLIEAQVNKWKNDLQKLNRLKLNQIGIFSLSNEQKILFLPLTTRNYLTEAYGLTSFVHKPVRARIKEIKKTKQPVQPVKMEHQFITSENLTSQSSPKNRPVFRFVKYAAVFVIGLGLIGGGVAYYYNQQKQQPVFQKATFVLQDNFPAVTIGNTQHETAGLSNDESVTSVDNKYFIISGAFRNRQNAEKKVNELKTNGYNASIVGKNKYNLWMVAYESFPTYESAHQKLPEIRKIQKGAWVFTKE